MSRETDAGHDRRPMRGTGALRKVGCGKTALTELGHQEKTRSSRYNNGYLEVE